MPSTPSKSASRSAPARAWAASSASWSASTRASEVGGLLGRLLALDPGGVDGGPGRLPLGVGPLDLGHQRALDQLGRVALGPQLLAADVQLGDGGGQLLATRPGPAQLALDPLGRRPQRPQLAADLGDGAGGRGRRHRVERGQASSRSSANAASSSSSSAASGSRRARSAWTVGQLLAGPGGVALEAGDDAGVEELAPVPLQRPAALGDHGAQAAGPLAQLLDLAQLIADVLGATGGQLGPDRHDVGVEPGELGLQPGLGLGAVELGRRQRRELGPQRGDLAAGDVHAQRRELADQLAVAAGGLGLTLERAQLAADLAQQVLDPQQVGLGGVEAALGLLLALAVLEDAGGLLDDPPPVLGPGVEDGVDLALADDDVLLAADAGVREQLLHVEQPAGHVVDGVLALAGAEERAADGDLGELDAAAARPSCRSSGRPRPGPRAGRLAVPAKMTSSIFWLRTELGACAPSTQAMASTTFDLPDPLGPTTTVTPGSSSIVVASANDLKPLRVRDFRNTAAKRYRWSRAAAGILAGRWHQGQWWVLRPALTVRRMIPRPQVSQRSPARPYTRWSSW